MFDAIVIGGGPSGLAAATTLKGDGKNVMVLEAAPQVGGNIRTETVDGHLMERGPHSFLGSAVAVWELIEKVGLSDAVLETKPEARSRYIWREGSLRKLPSGPWSAVTTSILTPGAKLRLLAEPFVGGGAREDDTVETFFRRRFGPEAAEYLAGPFVSGIYAGDAGAIGARASFPTLWGAEKDSGSIIMGMLFGKKEKKDNSRPKKRGLFSVEGGLGRLAETLAAEIGDDLHTSTLATGVVRRDDGTWEVTAGDQRWSSRSVIVACPPDGTADLLAGLDAEVAQLLRGIPFSSVVVVHMAGPDPCPFPLGFGFLVPRSSGIQTLGTVCVSNLFPGRAPAGRWLATSFIGGSLNPEALDRTDEDLTETVLADNSRLVEGPVEPDLVRLIRHTAAIPQLMPDHPERMAQILDAVSTRHPGLFLAGNYLAGVGIRDAAASGLKAAGLAEAWLGAEEPRP